MGFVMEQVLGHVSWAQTLRRAIEAIGGVDARWVHTKLFDDDSLLGRVPGLPGWFRAGAQAFVDTRRGLSGFDPDVLLFNTQKPALFCQWDLTRVPSLIMTDATPRQMDEMSMDYGYAATKQPVAKAVKHRLYGLNFRLAKALIPCSEWAKESMVRDYGVPAERVHVLPLGVDTALWRPREGPRRAGPVRILFVGGDFERKGGDLLLEVFARRLADRAELSLVTGPDVPSRPGVNIHTGLRPNTPELIALYQDADLFVLPTRADCFPNAAVEAIAAGLPAVIGDIGGTRDIVVEDENGFLVSPGDSEKLARVLERLVDDAELRGRMSRASRARAVNKFDTFNNVRRIVDVATQIAHT